MHSPNKEEPDLSCHPFSWNYSEEEIANQAAEELGETPEKVRQGVAALRAYISKHGLPTCDDEAYLLKFLRVKKFRHSDSYKMLEGFTRSLKALQNSLGLPDPKKLREPVAACSNGIIRYRDHAGRPTMYFRYGVYSRLGIPVEDAAQASLVILFFLMQQPTSQTLGINWIVNCKNICFQDVYDSLNFGMMFLRYLAGIPLRINRFDIINESSIFKICFNALKPFAPIKVLKRVSFHGQNLNSLREYYGTSSLPNEFGGTDGPVSNEHWMDQLDATCDALARLQLKAASQQNL